MAGTSARHLAAADHISAKVLAVGKLAQARPRLGLLPSKLGAVRKVALPFYRLPEWPVLVASLIKRRGRKCEAVGCSASGGRIYADHIVELKDGGAALDPANIQLLCASCHGKKTARERARRSGIG